MRNFSSAIFSAAFVFLFMSCGQSDISKNRGEIIFGDSASIVTENDPRYLSNNVTDFVPQKPVIQEQPVVEATSAVIDTLKPVVEKPEPAKNVAQASVKMNGLQAPFENLNIIINDINSGLLLMN